MQNRLLKEPREMTESRLMEAEAEAEAPGGGIGTHLLPSRGLFFKMQSCGKDKKEGRVASRERGACQGLPTIDHGTLVSESTETVYAF